MTRDHHESTGTTPGIIPDTGPGSGSIGPGRLGLLLLAGGALIIRLIAGARAGVIPRDSILFLDQASLFAHGQVADALALYQHPLFAALTAGMQTVLPVSLETAGTLVSVVAGSLAVIPLARLVGAVFGREAGLAAGWIYAALPLAVRLSARPLSEGVFHFFLLLAAWTAYRAAQGRLRLALAAGLAAGLAYLARPEGLVIAIAGGLVVTVPAFSRPWSTRLKAASALVLGLVLTAGPYMAFLSHQQGRWVLSAKKDVAVLGGLRADRPVQPLSDEGLAGRPLRAAGQLAHHLAESLSYVALGLAVIGLAAPGRRRHPGELYLALIVALFAFLLFRVAGTYGYLAKRHTLTLGLFFLGWAGVGLERVAAGLARCPWPRARSRIPANGEGGPAADPCRARTRFLFPGLLAVTVLGFLPSALKDVDRAHEPLRALGRWILARQGEGRVIEPLGYGRVAYYARARTVDILSRNQAWWSSERSPDSFDDLGTALEQARVEIVIQSSRQPAPLRRWLETHARLLHRVHDEKGRRWWAARSLASP